MHPFIEGGNPGDIQELKEVNWSTKDGSRGLSAPSCLKSLSRQYGLIGSQRECWEVAEYQARGTIKPHSSASLPSQGVTLTELNPSHRESAIAQAIISARAEPYSLVACQLLLESIRKVITSHARIHSSAPWWAVSRMFLIWQHWGVFLACRVVVVGSSSAAGTATIATAFSHLTITATSEKLTNRSNQNKWQEY